RLNQIFEVDLALRIILVEDNDQLIFMDPATDPYPNANASGELIGLNTGVINQIIGFDAYEFGHLFNSSCDTGGLASLGAVCGGNKASAITCHYTSNFEYAMVRITAHEMGHSFDAPHTWNLCQIGSTDNMNSGTAYEPGSGNTIMSYHGVCNPTQDVPEGPHDYYHANSLERIYNFTDGFGGNCPETTETDNHFPEITLPYTNGFYIPISTPFELYAEATDEDGDQLTYCWEQYDLSPLNTPLGSPQGNEPSFRSFPPTPDPMRVFPRMSNVLSNTSTNYEVLPTYSRTLTFRCSVRDNNPTIGAAVWDEVGFFATQEAGPFLVMVPNGPELWTVGDYTEVTWDVANTDGDLVNCQHVNILLSVDGGQTFPYTLAENTPNDGSRFVVVPQAVTNLARVRIEAADNIFFDLSNGNFSIQEASAPGFNFDAFPHMQQVCIPESATIELPMISILGFEDPVTFSVEGLPNGAVANFTNNPANPADGTELTIDMSNAEQVSAQYEVLITAMVEGVDTILRTVYLNTVSNDFSTLALAAPSYGEVNVIETPTFDWATTNNAFAYEFQLATSPSFSPESIVEEQTLTAPPFISDILLEKSTAYFWRIRPVNDCGPGPYTSTFAFHTEVFACANYASVNVPVNISAQGTPTVESVIEVTESGSISDINVIKIKGQHDLVKHIAVSLVSPEGTEVEMFSGVCPGSNTALFNMGIDDESPLSISCPPNAGISYQPQTPGIMATFNGEDSQGLWTLKVKVINTDGNGGSLQDWALQICSNATVAAPFLVNNELLLVPPGAFNYILQDELFTDDEDNAPNELEYTIVEAPTQGNLIYQGEVLEVGEVFRQSTINAGNLTYAHTPGAEMTDQFVFTVSDGNGGWVPPTVFQIQMDPNATVSTTNLFKENRLLVFPNPTNSFLNVKLATPINAPIEARLYNVQGQLVASQLTKTGMDLIQFDAKRLSAGLYFVELSLKGERIVEKVAVFK
ncbi:MAG TPA: T9SS type A sorting domain-containing protein, partial [Phaeodactylibacter sp.]|nr:T9SS type A sorting domain-containing protein [Phaeodactylibacter sp.]